MKKLIPITGLLLLPLIVPAQTGFFLKPAIGAGITNTTTKNFLIPIEGKNILSTEYELSVGYRAGRIAVSIGAGYLTTGYKERRTISTDADPFNGPIDSVEVVTLKAAFRHVFIPLHISYIIPLNRFSLAPEAGVDGLYNIGVLGSANGATIKKSRYTSGV